MLSARRSVGKLSRLGEFRHVSTGLRSGEILIESRVFSKDDVHRFVKLSSDENKIHTDDDIAQKFGFRRAIVPGILSASLFPAAISKKFPGAVYMSQTLKFRHPALVGERLKAEVLFLGQRSRGKHMTFLTTCKIDDDMSPSNGVIVVDGTAMARIE